MVLVSAFVFFVFGCADEITAPGPGTPPVALELAPDSARIAPEDSVQLSATLRDRKGDPVSGYAVSWSSNDTTVATVDDDGTVLAVDTGRTGVVASAPRNGKPPLTSDAPIVVGTASSSQTGGVEADFSTSGESVDDDGYTVTIDDSTSKAVGPNGTVAFTELGVGERLLEVSGLKSNCALAGDNPRTISVNADTTTSVSIGVNCTATAGGLEVSTSTSGVAPSADGYTITVDGSDSQSVGPNDQVTFAGLSAGDHQVELEGLSSRCAVDGQNPRTVTVESGRTINTSFSILCEALLTDLSPSNYAIGTATVGTDVYVDRDYTIAEVPAAFDGSTYIQTANDDKNSDAASALTFTLNDTATVAVAYDARASTLPDWLSGWTDTGDVLGTTDVSLDLYTRVFGPGDVVLGGNRSGGAEGAQSMYGVLAAPTDAAPTPTGRLEVTASTSGDDLDGDGYTVTVDGTTKALDTNGSTVFYGLREDSYSVELSGVAENCSIEGSNPRSVSVTNGTTASTQYTVNCTSTSGSLEVSASTAGDNQDANGYTVAVGGSSRQSIDSNGSVTFSDVSAGNRAVELTGLQSNCSVDGPNPQTVSITTGNTASTSFSVNCEASSSSRNAILWEYEEWSVENASYSGNPFDVIATVTFDHQGSGKTHTTGMFYDGGDTWKFRFTGTRTGTWTYTSSSNDPELDGLSGTVDVADNMSSDIGGFLKTKGNKFGRQVSGNGDLAPMVWSVYNDEGETTFATNEGYKLMSNWTESNIRSYARRAKSLGMNHIFLTLYNQVIEEDALGYDEHNRSTPGFSEFRTIENVIRWAKSEGLRVHFWMWGDEVRKWTSVGLSGGINGTVDNRIQRYISARLGPIPGWTMGYGFDLGEWVSNSQLDTWASQMHDHMGWDHLLMARKGNTNLTNTDVKSDNRLGPESFNEATALLETDKPYVEEERFLYKRSMKWGPQTFDMDTTMDMIWRLGMAEGSGAIWGSSSNGESYPNPERLKTFGSFMSTYLRFDMTATDNLSDGIGMAAASNEHYLFFKKSTSSIQVDLSGMNGPQSAVAVNTRAPYQEIDLGTLQATSQTVQLPSSSDWAIAVGNF